jgi:predicted alpha/beta-hydrolase family hydrolase
MSKSLKSGNGVDGGRPVTITVDSMRQVSALLQTSREARACYVLAHGAGAGMRHPFLAEIARGLAERGIATLRYQFPYMEQGSRRPDAPKLAHATVRAAAIEAARLLPELPLFAGGKSFGGRMTSQAQAASPLPAVHGLIFLGFPLHPPGQPSTERATHLFEVKIPMLFLQGDRDEFAQMDLLNPLIEQLGPGATLKLFPSANHSFHVPARSARNDSEIKAEMLGMMADWMSRALANGPSQGTQLSKK